MKNCGCVLMQGLCELWKCADERLERRSSDVC